MAAFLAMGGYAVYVWTAFGITAVVIVGNIVAAQRRMRSIQGRLRMQLLRRAGQAAGERAAPGGHRSGTAY